MASAKHGTDNCNDDKLIFIILLPCRLPTMFGMCLVLSIGQNLMGFAQSLTQLLTHLYAHLTSRLPCAIKSSHSVKYIACHASVTVLS